MAKTLAPANGNAVLNDHPNLAFNHRQFEFRITTANGKSTYTVTDGREKITALLMWAFGLGHVGQSYLYEKNGAWYEARISFFPALSSIGFTPSRALDDPQDVSEAMARPVGAEELRRCFACHSTGLTSKPIAEQSKLGNGIACEACHGPGAKHVAIETAEKMQSGETTGSAGADFLFDPRKLLPADSVDFCGSCHATWWDVEMSGVKGVSSVRSQAYRLENSKCWGIGDARITCVACHDPHGPLEKKSEAYDSKCLACHLNSRSQAVTASHPGKACPVATSDCASCHMPKIEIPEMHYRFTDHEIRVVEAGKPVPD